MKYKNLIISIFLHLIFGIVAWIGMPKIHRDFDAKDQTIVMELVPISEITNIKNTVAKKAPLKKEPNKDKPEKKIPDKVPEKSPKKAVEKSPKKAVEKSPKKPQSKLKNSPTVPSKSSKKEIPQKKEVKKVEPKVEHKKKKTKKTENHSKKILKSLEKESPPAPNKKEKSDLEKMFEMAEDESFKGESNKEFDDSKEMSLSEIDAIRKQITESWNPAAFQGSGQVMIVTLSLKLDISGEIISVKPILDRNNTNPSYSVFVDSVVRAANKASPLKNLSSKKFSQWEEIELRFTSEDMMY